MILVKIDTAFTVLIGPVLDADGVAVTGLNASAFKLTKNGSVGDPNGSTTATHSHTGHYVYAANAGDASALGVGQISINSTTNAMSPVSFMVLTEKNYNALILGTDNLEVDLIQILGTALTETSSGYLAAAFKKLLDVATPLLTVAAVMRGTDGAFTDPSSRIDAAISSRAAPGAEMDLKDAPNATAVTAIQSGLATATNVSDLQTHGDNTWATATGFSTHDAAAVVSALETNGSKLDHLWEMTENDGGTRRLTTNSLELAPSGGLTAQQTRDAMKLAPSAGDPVAGSIDKALDNIEDDSNELQTDWEDGGRLDTLLDAASGVSGDVTTITENTLDVNSVALGTINIGGVPVSSARVIFAADADTNFASILYQTLTDGDGGFSISIPSGATYRMKAIYSGYTSPVKRITI